MRGCLKLVSATALALALIPSSQASGFTGIVSFSLSTLPGLAAWGGGDWYSVSTVDPNLMAIDWTTGGVAGPTLITLAPTAAAPLSALNIRLTAPGPCTFSGTPMGGACALGGTANALVGGAPFLIVPFANTAGTIGLGVGGRLSFGSYGSYFDAQPWTTGVAPVTINGVTLTTGNATSPGAPIFMTGYDFRTAGGVGQVALVAPAGLMSTLGGNFPLFVSLSIQSAVPEPGTLLMLGSGIAGLAMLGRRRMRARS